MRYAMTVTINIQQPVTSEQEEEFLGMSPEQLEQEMLEFQHEFEDEIRSMFEPIPEVLTMKFESKFLVEGEEHE